MVKYVQKGFSMAEYTSLEKIRLEKIEELTKEGLQQFLEQLVVRHDGPRSPGCLPAPMRIVP